MYQIFRDLLADVTPAALILLGGVVLSMNGPTHADVTVKMTQRTALGLLRSLKTGSPMAGPDVEPLIASLSGALGADEPSPAELRADYADHHAPK